MENLNGAVRTHILGRTGERVSMIGLGGFHIGNPDLDEAESVRIIRSAIDNGITVSWTIVGTITMEKARYVWVKR